MQTVIDRPTTKYLLKGMACAGCAAKIEKLLQEQEGMHYTQLNFAAKSIYLKEEHVFRAQQIINSIEPGVELVPVNLQEKKYKLKGLHCTGCAAKIQSTLSKTGGLENSALNFAAGTLLINPQYFRQAQEIIDSIEPGVILEEINKPQEEKSNIKKPLTVMGIAFVLLATGLVFDDNLRNTRYTWAEYTVFLSAYFLVGWKVLLTAFRNIFKGNMLDENFLMTLATGGAIAIHLLPEAVGVMFFFYVGEFFQNLAVNRSRASIKALLDIKPEYANLKLNGNIEKVSPETVHTGDFIIIKPGEKVPLDGIITEGFSFFDTSALTGESVPKRLKTGEEVLAGMINTSGLITIQVSRQYADSAVAKILDLVENAGSRKAPVEKFITRFSYYYTPAVVLGAAALAFVPPLVIPGAVFSDWLHRALVLLVISCPCALVVSIPLGYFGGIGGASKRGILVKGANFLDALTGVNTVVFDKTGTLTRGVFHVTDIKAQNNFSPEDVLKYAAKAEANSYHPIARSIMEAYDGNSPYEQAEAYEEIAGCGIKAKYKSQLIIAGNEKLLDLENIPYERCVAEGTIVYIAVNGLFAGCITIADEIKEDSFSAISKLRKLGVKQVVMLTGDDETAAADVSSRLELDAVYSRLLPQDKLARLEKLMANLSIKEKLAFVGDGINDAPVITRADVGIAMGGLGSDAAIEAADIVIMDDQPGKVAVAIDIARHTKKIVLQNIIMALTVKGIFVALGSIGQANMWEAVFADVGVALLAVLNATRVLKHKENY
ncbi:cadmium-translocating P-type ATPase [Desulfofarcimen acetoxidans DSM 771]|uniref:Cd(2+)-exporting ATPase n=1 Tax=Desulfofarcimen acetoxidans (strain ATCC 49208 / DSM 771 / KCTC 5769 / VKM B-1644 / 5575) TaxID=485916 RepID=C8VX23_DESAS|nr:heavy metal translocating P-type ATPase [Desulfofarcimen acetoxidans]ACV62599.1 cadmium-translocating P-type ATPase [Desulfofarcimen acetoxidans DSM 771]